MKLILIRHGEVAGIEPPHFRGREDLELLPVGMQQAAATANRIAAIGKISGLYSSPLRRCMETAAPIGEAIGTEVRSTPAFTDIDYGAWQGLEIEAARQRFGSHVVQWLAAPHLTVLPGGNVLADVLARITRAIDGLVEKHGNETVVVVTHDSVIRLMLLSALDLPMSHYWTLRQDPCAISEIEAERDRQTARVVNDTSHLIPTGNPGR